MRHHNDGLRKVCGCPRRVWAKCRHPWKLNLKWEGKHWRVSLDKELKRHIRDKSEARREANKIRDAIQAGTFRQSEFAPVQTPEALTLISYGETFVRRFSKEIRHKASWRDDQRRLRRVGAFILPDGTRFGSKLIGAITEDDVEAYLAAVRDSGRSASTRNHYLQLFKSLSKWGVKKGYLTRPWLAADSDLKREKPARRNRRLRADAFNQDGRLTEPGEERLLL